ncbi:MAG: T9SS type A sorting domain-containing protein [candidate division Zixibacteria bacterium]|nr:T9SS type A sorting domain-containing protein [Candidatus Tariuqbacter arcticus]
MKRALLFVLALFILSSGIVIGSEVDKKQLINRAAYPLNADFLNNSEFGTPIPYIEPHGGTDDPVLVGMTFYDFANYGSLTKLIALDDSAGVHFAWTCGENINSGTRHVYYNYYNIFSGSWTYPGTGNVTWAATRSGFNNLDVLSDGRAVVAAHSNLSGIDEYPTMVGVDYSPGMGAFWPVTQVPCPAVCDTVIWPHMAVDIDDNIYVFSRRYPFYEGDPRDFTELYYSKSEDLGSSYDQFIFADTVNVPSFTVATSRISRRAALGYHQFLEDYNYHPLWSGFLALQINNDAFCIIKEDGQDWDWENPVNITNIIKGDASFLPDTILAQGDTLRAYLDIDLMFDHDDVLHAMFTCRGLYEAPWDTTPPPISGLTEASFIWHWRQDTDSLNVVANGWWNCAYNISTGGAGAWKSTSCRPSMGIDDEGNLYCVYEGYHDFETNPDTSAISMGNGDIFVTVSTDGGYNWAEAMNLTDTNSNNAIAGDCMSECFPSLAEVVDEFLHIFYMEDKDAGSYVFDEGLSTENPMWYVALDKTEVPTTPLIEQFYFHIVRDSVGVKQTPDIQPSDFALKGNYPNPFNASTNFVFSLKTGMKIEMNVYDIQGRLCGRLAEGFYPQGEHTVNWNAAGLSSGIYFCKLAAGGYAKTVKALLVK